MVAQPDPSMIPRVPQTRVCSRDSTIAGVSGAASTSELGVGYAAGSPASVNGTATLQKRAIRADLRRRAILMVKVPCGRAGRQACHRRRLLASGPGHARPTRPAATRSHAGSLPQRFRVSREHEARDRHGVIVESFTKVGGLVIARSRRMGRLCRQSFDLRRNQSQRTRVPAKNRIHHPRHLPLPLLEHVAIRVGGQGDRGVPELVPISAHTSGRPRVVAASAHLVPAVLEPEPVPDGLGWPGGLRCRLRTRHEPAVAPEPGPGEAEGIRLLAEGGDQRRPRTGLARPDQRVHGEGDLVELAIGLATGPRMPPCRRSPGPISCVKVGGR